MQYRQVKPEKETITQEAKTSESVYFSIRIEKDNLEKALKSLNALEKKIETIYGEGDEMFGEIRNDIREIKNDIQQISERIQEIESNSFRKVFTRIVKTVRG